MTRPTQPFRDEHAALQKHLQHLNAFVGQLATGITDEPRPLMRQVAAFVHEHIKPHADWEERVLYPAVDKRAASGKHPFTASMRHEHRIVARWADELSHIAASAHPDPKAFARRADNLLGLITAHFEEEEEVLLPILDASMTAEEFEREIGKHGG